MAWLVLSLCQIAAGQGQAALEDAGDDPGWGAAAVAFEVELALESLRAQSHG